MSVKERLIEFIKYKNIGQAAFEKRVGLSNGYVNNIKKSIGEDILQKIVLQFPELNDIWLILGKGDMLKAETNSVLDLKKGNEKKITGYYYPDVSASAGLENNLENSELDRIAITIPNWGSGLDFVNVYGDSMYPKFCSGEVVGIKSVEKEYVIFGHAYVVVFEDGQVFIKYIRKGNDSDHWLLASENNKYESQEFHLSKIRKVYVVKGVITKLTM